MARTKPPQGPEDAPLAAPRDVLRDPRRADALLHLRSRILERLARDQDQATILGDLVRSLEGELPTSCASVLLLTNEGSRLRHAAAPNLPRGYVEAIDGSEVGPAAGSCPATAHLNRPLSITQVASDPLWEHHRHLLLPHELHACWSFPLAGPEGRPAGVLALYLREPRTPTSEEREFVQGAARLAELLLDRDRKREGATESEARYRSLFHSIDEAFCILEMLFDEHDRPVDYRFLEVNPTFERHTGIEDAVGRTARELVPDLDPSWVETYGAVALTGEGTRFSNPEPALGRWFDTFAFRIGRPEERQVALLFKDVTKDVTAEATLRESERRHRTLAGFRRSVMRLTEDGLEARTAEAFYQRILDEAVHVIPGAQAGSILLRTAGGAFRFVAAEGYDLGALQQALLPEHAAGFGQVRRGLEPRIVCHPTTAPELASETTEILHGPGRHDEIEVVLIVPIVVDEVLTAFLTLDNFEDAKAFSSEAVEMSRVFAGHVATLVKRFALEEELQRLAFQDPLTGLPNRAMFREHLSRTLEKARDSGARTAVMFVDLDNLKPINDSLGHPTGDEVLRAVAQRLRPLEGEDALVARVGGDEFTVVLSARHVEREARRLARRILAELTEPIRAGEHELHISASIGISVHPSAGADGDDLLRHADIAMYHAKKGGKNDYAIFAPKMEAAPLERLLLEKALREGLEKDQFVLYFEPRVDMATARVVCVEALVRWQHAERGTVPPALFIPLAETTNLIHPLGRRILEMAARQARVWRDAGFRDLRIAVNLSARQLERPEFVGEVAAILAAEELPPSALELEVLESVAMADVTRSVERLRALKRLGVSIALDDFGMGHSSLAYLRHLPVDTIKIDRAFLEDLTDGSTAHDPLAIVRAITALGNSFGMTVVAEGIEERVQWEELRSVGCHEGQGFLLGRARPAAELDDLLVRGFVTP